MACTSCPAGTVTTDLTYTSVQAPTSMVDTGPQIPLKIGFPLSSACERSTIVGSIPVVIPYANFTLVNGGIPAYAASNGGISNLGSFFKNPQGCYKNDNARLASTCC